MEVNLQYCHLCRSEMRHEDIRRGYFKNHKETYDRCCMKCVRESY